MAHHIGYLINRNARLIQIGSETPPRSMGRNSLIFWDRDSLSGFGEVDWLIDSSFLADDTYCPIVASLGKHLDIRQSFNDSPNQWLYGTASKGLSFLTRIR